VNDRHDVTVKAQVCKNNSERRRNITRLNLCVNLKLKWIRELYYSLPGSSEELDQA